MQQHIHLDKMKKLLPILALLAPVFLLGQSITLDSEWDTTTKINTHTTDQNFIVQSGTVDINLVNLTDATQLIISSGAITVTNTLHSVRGESNDTPDQVDSIAGGVTGDLLILTVDTGDTITFANGTSGSDNLDFAGQDVVLDSINERLMLEYNGTNWIIISVSPFVMGVSSVELKGGVNALSDDGYNGIFIAGKPAGETITQWDVVYLDGTSNEWMQADADAAGEFPARGIAVEAGSDGNALKVLVQGTIRNDGWSWTNEGKTLFLSDTAAGLTETAPRTSGDAVQILGYSLTDDEIYFNAAGHYAEVE